MPRLFCMRLYRSRLTCKPKTKFCNAYLVGAP